MWKKFRMKKEKEEQTDISEQEKNQEQTTETSPCAEKTCENCQGKEENSAEENADANSDTQENLLTQDDIKELKEKAAKADEYWGKLVQLVADFDNFKKRTERKRVDDILSAKVAVIETVLPVLDNFEMAFSAAANVTDPAAKSLKLGIEMVLTQFRSVLGNCGVECIDPKDQPFDASYHEAVSELETNDIPEGSVAQVLRKGYKMSNRLIRAARVVVARKVSESKE